jgi:hypothetical protein
MLHWVLRLRGYMRLDVRPCDRVLLGPGFRMLPRPDLYDWVPPNHSHLSVIHGPDVEGGDDLVGVLFRVVKSQAADREIDDFMTVPRSRPG